MRMAGSFTARAKFAVSWISSAAVDRSSLSPYECPPAWHRYGRHMGYLHITTRAICEFEVSGPSRQCVHTFRPHC